MKEYLVMFNAYEQNSFAVYVDAPSKEKAIEAVKHNPWKYVNEQETEGYTENKLIIDDDSFSVELNGK